MHLWSGVWCRSPADVISQPALLSTDIVEQIVDNLGSPHLTLRPPSDDGLFITQTGYVSFGYRATTVMLRRLLYVTMGRRVSSLCCVMPEDVSAISFEMRRVLVNEIVERICQMNPKAWYRRKCVCHEQTGLALGLTNQVRPRRVTFLSRYKDRMARAVRAAVSACPGGVVSYLIGNGFHFVASVMDLEHTANGLTPSIILSGGIFAPERIGLHSAVGIAGRHWPAVVLREEPAADNEGLTGVVARRIGALRKVVADTSDLVASRPHVVLACDKARRSRFGMSSFYPTLCDVVEAYCAYSAGDEKVDVKDLMDKMLTPHLEQQLKNDFGSLCELRITARMFPQLLLEKFDRFLQQEVKSGKVAIKITGRKRRARN